MYEEIKYLCNNGIEPLEVWLEPWAIDFTLSPGESLNVVGRSKQKGKFEVTEIGNVVGIYGWPGSSIQVFHGEELLDELPVMFHDGPPSGKSMREFIESVFGGLGGP